MEKELKSIWDEEHPTSLFNDEAQAQHLKPV